MPHVIMGPSILPNPFLFLILILVLMGYTALPNPHCRFLLLIFLLILVNLPSPALSLSFNYTSMGDSVRQHLAPEGNVTFCPNHVKLSTWHGNDPSQSASRVYHQDQLFLWNSATREVASFNCSFAFSVLGNGGAHEHVDGLTFFLLERSLASSLKQKKQQKPRGFWLGLLNGTYPNPSDNHVGIDVGPIVSASYCNVPLDSCSVFAWVDYSGSKSLLEVYATNVSSTKPSSPLKSYSINFALFLPEYVSIGFSVATRAASEHHRIHSWSFSSTSIRGNATATGVNMPPSVDLRQAPALSLDRLTSIYLPPLLPFPPLPPAPEAWAPSNNKSSNQGLIVGTVTACIFGVAFVIGGLLVWWRRRRRRTRELRRSAAQPSGSIGLRVQPSSDPPDVGYGPRNFDYTELSEATTNFGESFLLGEGGFGTVYKGVLPSDGSDVAVKCISHRSAQGEKEFLAEVSIISRIRHKNLVQLKGWCRERSNLLLVYEYMPNGSLDHYLFCSTSSSILDWGKRYNIVCGLGFALQYLHQECEKVIVHRDIKASNVMLDANYNAKLGDFGLARQLGEGVEGHTTLAAGTPGYMAPETYRIGRATTESDVYSYGIVLLEVACGRRPIDPSLPGQFEGCLLDWVWDLYSKEALKEAVDARLKGAFDEEELARTLIVGLACAHPDPKSRPSIRLALEALQGRVSMLTIPTFKPVAYYGPSPPLSASQLVSSPTISSS